MQYLYTLTLSDLEVLSFSELIKVHEKSKDEFDHEMVFYSLYVLIMSVGLRS